MKHRSKGLLTHHSPQQSQLGGSQPAPQDACLVPSHHPIPSPHPDKEDKVSKFLLLSTWTALKAKVLN